MRPYKRAMRAVVSELRAHTRLVEILGSVHRIRRRVGVANVPGVEYTIINDDLEENTAPMEVQFSIFAETANDLEEMDEILFDTLHSDQEVEIGGVLMRPEYMIGRAVEDPAEGVLHRAVDYRFTLARED